MKCLFHTRRVFYMQQNCDKLRTVLLPLRKKSCYGFLPPFKSIFMRYFWSSRQKVWGWLLGWHYTDDGDSKHLWSVGNIMRLHNSASHRTMTFIHLYVFLRSKLTTRRRVVLQKLILSHPATAPCPEPADSSPHCNGLLLRLFNIIHSSTPRFSKYLFPSCISYHQKFS
jgi:hypothetical protein